MRSNLSLQLWPQRRPGNACKRPQLGLEETELNIFRLLEKILVANTKATTVTSTFRVLRIPTKTSCTGPLCKMNIPKICTNAIKMRTFQYLLQMPLLFRFFCSVAISLLCQSRLGFQQCFLLFFWLLLMLANAFLKVFITTSGSRCFTKIQLLRKAESNSGDTRCKVYFPRPWTQCIFSYYRAWYITHCILLRAQYKNPLIYGRPQLYAPDCRDEVHRTVLFSALNPFPCLKWASLVQFPIKVLPAADIVGHDQTLTLC